MINTTSMLMSHHQRIEEKQSNFYESLVEKFPQYSALFKTLSKDHLRHMEMAQRAYREGVTDAFEVGFLSNPINPDNYKLVTPNGNIHASIEIMIKNENTIIKYCEDVIQNSSKLLPDILATFERLVKRKKKFIETLENLKKGD